MKILRQFLLMLVSACSLLYLASGLAGCKKFVAIEPPKTQIAATTVFADDASATAAIRGIYSQMISDNNFCSGSLSGLTLLCGYSADEFVYYGNTADKIQLYSNSLISTNGTIKNAFWQAAYQYINNANSLIEGLQQSTQLTATAKKQLMGEAIFIRVFCHFYLVNLFGDIPYITSTDYRVNKSAARMSSAVIYQNLVAELKNAQGMLSGDYSFSNGERDQPNQWAATALLARVYLYEKDWANAAAQASSVIAAQPFSLLTDLNSVFLKNSLETIWQLKPVQPGLNTNEGNYFILTTAPAEVSLSPDLLNAFEAGDKRKSAWTGSYTAGATTYFYPNKYKIKSSNLLTEYSMVLRLAEQYLILAEAQAQQNNLVDALANINTLRRRAGLSDLPATISQQDLLLAIEKERRVEFFAEWGQRWLDLKRTQRADNVLGLIKGTNWQTTDALFPIPESERTSDPNLSQNPGY